VFRADTRPPSEVFVTGFARLTHEVPQLGMSLDVGGIAHHLVSTSKSATDAAEFAVIRGRDPRTMAEVRSGVRSNRSRLTRVWIYLCLATRGFYLLAPGEARRNRHEVALIGIPTTHVLAAVEFDVERITATGRWHANPHSALPRELVDTLHRLMAEIIRHLTSPHLNV
jgi:hypothetical protein